MLRKYLLIITENAWCVIEAHKSIPNGLITHKKEIFKVSKFQTFAEVEIEIAKLFSFTQLYKMGAENGIEEGKVYRR